MIGGDGLSRYHIMIGGDGLSRYHIMIGGDGLSRCWWGWHGITS